MSGWAPVPGKDPSRKRDARPETHREFEVTTKAQLKSRTKDELVEEVHRLQTNMREIAIEMGIARRSKGSEYTIDPHFCGNVISILKASWSHNL